jgi:hypothetical protein
MGNSTDKTSASAFILLLLVLVATGLAYVGQASSSKKFEGTFPVVKPMTQGEFHFYPDRVEIKLAEDPLPVKRIVVFAYDAQEREVCILKPVYDQTVVLTRDNYPDYRVRFRNGNVDGYDLLQGHGGIGEKMNFVAILNEAKESGRRYGVQECLYPICTRCMDVCPVIKQGVIKMKVDEDGAFYPAIHLAGCPRSGKCMEACKQRIICRSVDLPPRVPASGEMETVPFQPPDLEKALQHMTY